MAPAQCRASRSRLVVALAAMSVSVGACAAGTPSAPRPQSLGQRTSTVAPEGQPRAPHAKGDPFAGRHGWVDPSSDAAQAATAARRSSHPHQAKLLRRIATHPSVTWIGDWDPTDSVARTVRGDVRTQRKAGALPVFVLYAIPHRDCGGASSGGLADAAAYRAWVNHVARGIGAARAVTIVEPDALAGLDCLSAADQTSRERMIAAAVTRLDQQPHVSVYLDAGNETWQPASVMAQRLQAANVAHARGFSLNVSNFYPTASEERYGDAIVAALPKPKHFLVDTSRNGRGSDGQWCNPPGRGLGVPWTTATGDPRADALIWVKPPGESDGTCNGGPAAGQFWTSYALGLARRRA